MTQQDFRETFQPLFDAYPAIIARMPAEFTSHQFIILLAQEMQTAYIEALHAYRLSERSGRPSPFLIVHGLLAQHLDELPDLVEKVGRVNSTDIFGVTNECALWQRKRDGAAT